MQPFPNKHIHTGIYSFLQKILQELHIDEFLRQLANERKREAIIALALNRIIRLVAIHLFSFWYEESTLALINPELPVSSQAISNLLADIGTSGVPEKFMLMLVQEIGTKSTLVFNITSLSSYSPLISLLEYGYNRDGLDLPQINVSVILDANHAIPVMYDIYPGSIVDIVTRKNTINNIRACGVKEYSMVLDRFFSVKETWSNYSKPRYPSSFLHRLRYKRSKKCSPRPSVTWRIHSTFINARKCRFLSSRLYSQSMERISRVSAIMI